jgi:Peptidase family M23
MTTGNATSTLRALVGLVAGLIVLVTACLGLEVTPGTSPTAEAASGGYQWPVPPFHRQHPIRGYFGDPRTTFHGSRSTKTLMTADGVFAYHFGVDISAPDGSPVYAVRSGRVSRIDGKRVDVRCADGRRFEYWHVEPSVRTGQRAVAGETVLGRIQKGRKHVHLTEVVGGRYVNPLVPGHLTPYSDHTKPEILDLRPWRDGKVVSGRATLVADVMDTPAMPVTVPDYWNGMPVTPAVVTWQIKTPKGKPVTRRQFARDVRRTIPTADRFWDGFARGTHQNFPVFERKYRGVKGRYLIKLTTRPFDTSTLRDGRYVLVVTARDTTGNRDTLCLRFAVANGAGLP